MTGSELRELLSSSPADCHRALMKEYGRYVYSIVFNKLRSCGTQEDIEECVCDVFADIFIKFEYDEKCRQTNRNRSFQEHFRCQQIYCLR